MPADLEQPHLAVNNQNGAILKELGGYFKLEGSVPFELASMHSLEILDLSSNLLTKEIPLQFGQMNGLETLNLSHNSFLGSIPSIFDEIVKLDIVYEFLEEGIVRDVLSNEKKARAFEWDISSHNILLNGQYDEAHISDFGMAKILKPESSNWTSLARTFGYAAPELAYTMEMNQRCDVYSFGIVTLGILMGKHPGDLISSISSTSSLSFSLHDEASLLEILDQRILPPTHDDEVAEEVVSLAKIALACSSGTPRCRPTMKEISKEM
nr:MDIS1-interacting receptor like kinase 2-like [Ziziphus jujuba var. spinosa]